MNPKKITTMLIVVGIVALLLFARTASLAARRDALPGAGGTLWVTNKALNNVAVFDASDGELLGVIPVGHEPIGVTAPHGSGKVYVSNEKDNTVSVIEKASLSVVATIPTGPRPHHINQAPNGKFVYVAEFGGNTVGVINTETDTLVAHFVTNPSPTARVHAVWVSADGQTLYVTNSGLNEIAALDALTGEPRWAMTVGANPSEVLVTDDEQTAYVSVRNENKVKVIDLGTRTITGEVFVGDQPDTLRLSPNGKTLVVTLRGTPARVAVVNVFKGLSAGWVSIAGATTGHHWLSANGHYSYVAVEGPGGVAVVDNRTLEVVRTFAYPAGGKPHGVFYEPSRLAR